MDLYNTTAHLAGVVDRIPTDRYIDGIDQTSFLLAKEGKVIVHRCILGYNVEFIH